MKLLELIQTGQNLRAATGQEREAGEGSDRHARRDAVAGDRERAVVPLQLHEPVERTSRAVAESLDSRGQADLERLQPEREVERLEPAPRGEGDAP